MAYRVFFSHGKADYELVRWISENAKAWGFGVYLSSTMCSLVHGVKSCK